MNVRLSEKHGVNASVDHCVFCGDSVGLVMFGRLKDDAEAPRDTCSGSACNSCQNVMSRGVLLCEVEDGSQESGKARKTGYVVGITREAAERISEALGDSKVALIEVSQLKALMGAMYREEVKLDGK